MCIRDRPCYSIAPGEAAGRRGAGIAYLRQRRAALHGEVLGRQIAGAHRHARHQGAHELTALAD
eukprot:8465133-Heterocapsa_arctica.AAC.1